jgi:general nucleoside transport system ATP-binding protein
MINIELRHIQKRFGSVHANNDISVAFRSGKIIGVLGENGAGKSTLMKILSGFQPADSGEIRINEHTHHAKSWHNPQIAIRNGIGMLQQDPLDIPAFTVIENFIYGLGGWAGLRRAAAVKQLRDLCARLGFSLDPDLPIAQLSIGQRQQLEIVRLLALGVKALILDEPTTGISAEQKTILFQALTDLAQRDGMIILLVSHKLEDVIALCDEVVVLRGGKLVGDMQMPATTAQLVSMMFGDVLAESQRPSAPISGVTVKLDNVTLRDKRVTIENFSLHIRSGEVIGLAGLDGSGQDMLLRACAGLIKPLRGQVIVNSHDLTNKPYRAYMAQGVAFGAAGRTEEGLIAGLTLTEHIALMQTGSVIDWDGARALTEKQLMRFNVRGRPDSQIQQLSGGNQQRLLMALLPEKPTLLALEQPTRGLDVDSARYIWTQLLARRNDGAAILFSSPDLDEIVAYSDRIFVLFAGRAVEIADAKQATIDQLGRLIGGQFDSANRAAAGVYPS